MICEADAVDGEKWREKSVMVDRIVAMTAGIQRNEIKWIFAKEPKLIARIEIGTVYVCGETSYPSIDDEPRGVRVQSSLSLS